MSEAPLGGGSHAMEMQSNKESPNRQKDDSSSPAEFAIAVRSAISELLRESESGPSIIAIANRMSLNVRTLQRRLEQAGVPFRDLLSDCRRECALEELRAGDLSVSDVSASLGYSDPAHFARAFRRWTGRSPIEFRRQIQKNAYR